MRKESTLSKVAYCIIIIALGFMVTGSRYLIVALHKPVDIYDENFNGVKKYMAIESDLDIIIPSFLEETVTRSQNGQTTSVSKYNYYSVPVFVGDECYYVALKASNNTDTDKQIRKVVKETVAYMDYRKDTYGDEIFAFKGGVFKMKNSIYSNMKSWFKESGFFESDADVEKYVLPYQLETIPSFQRVYIMFAVLAAVILVGIVMIIIDRKVIASRTQ